MGLPTIQYISDKLAITGSKDRASEAFNKGLILDGEGWMDMIKKQKSILTYQQ
jgi:hypothetical protein